MRRPQSAGRVGVDVVPRQRRQDHRAECHAEDAERELQQAIGLRQPGLRARDQKRGDDGVEQQVDLRHRAAKQGRHHQLQNPPHARMRPPPKRPDQQVEPAQRRKLHQQLHHAGDQNRNRQRHHRHLQQRCQPPGRGDHANVQDHRRRRRQSKAPISIERAAGQGGQRDEQQEGKGHPQQVGDQVDLGGVCACGWREQARDLRREQHAQRGHHQQHRTQRAGGARDQLAQLGLLAGLLVLGEHRHKGQRKRALREETTEEIGNAKGDPEGIGRRVGAEGLGDDHLAHQPQNPRQEGRAAEGGERTEEVGHSGGCAGAAAGAAARDWGLGIRDS